MSVADSPLSETSAITSPHHLWVGSSQLFQTSLFFVPGPRDPSISSELRLNVFDCDGVLANKLDIAFPLGKVGIVETEALLESCKAEGGFPHAHVVVETAAPYRVISRITTNDSAAILGRPQQLSASQGGFFPVTLGEERKSLLTLVNSGDSESIVRIRLFVGNRVPEVFCTIPARGSRILGVEGEFDNFIDRKKLPEDEQAYLRLTTRSDSSVYCNLIEHLSAVRSHGLFTSVC